MPTARAQPSGAATPGVGFLALRTQKKKKCVDEFSSNGDKTAEIYLSYYITLFFAGFEACVRKHNPIM